MLQSIKDLSIKLKISGFVIPSTISFGILMTVLSLYLLNDFKVTALDDFSAVLQQIEASSSTDSKKIDNQELLKGIEEKANTKLNTTAYLLISIVVGVIIMATVGALFIAHLIAKPITGVADGLENISSGDADLTQRLPVKADDETGHVSKFFNIFLEKLQGIIKDLQQSGIQVNKAAASIYAHIKIIQEKSESTKEISQKVYRSAGYMSRDMTEISTVLSESTENIHGISNAVDELSQTVTEISETSAKAHSNTENARKKMELLEGDVQELGKAGQDISKVTDTIAEISEQVNLLALNATIEAARAGEAGKGFAVVANEIKELAHQTANAATEIQTRINQVQKVTDTTISGIVDAASMVNENSSIVSTIASAVEEQSATVSEIAQSLNGASDHLDYSNNKISKAAEYAEDMAKMSNSVTDHVIEVDEAVAGIMNSSKTMKELAVKSVRTTRQFRT